MPTVLTVIGRWLRRLGFFGLLVAVPIMGLMKILALAPWGDLRVAFLLAFGCIALGGLLSLTSVIIRVERHRRAVRAAIAEALADEPADTDPDPTGPAPTPPAPPAPAAPPAVVPGRRHLATVSLDLPPGGRMTVEGSKEEAVCGTRSGSSPGSPG